MRYLQSILLCTLIAASLTVAAACREADTERAAEQARQAGKDATAALEEAGREVKEGAQELERRAQPLVEDAALTARVKARLAADPEVAAFQIDVDTTNRVVTLSGRVDSGEVRAEAEQLARETEGVETVVNRLTTRTEPAPATAPPGTI